MNMSVFYFKGAKRGSYCEVSSARYKLIVSMLVSVVPDCIIGGGIIS